MIRDLSKGSNLERLEKVVQRGYQPENITVRLVDKAGNIELVQLNMPIEGRAGQFSVGLFIEDEKRIGMFGGVSKVFLQQLMMQITEILVDKMKKKEE